MSLSEKLKQAGFKPEMSTEGEWQPYNGTYRCKIVTLRPEFDEKNQAHFVQAEYDIEDVLAGDMKRESKFPAFRKRYYLDWENPSEEHMENVKVITNDIFTATGEELVWDDKPSFVASAEKVIGQSIYLRAWGFTFDKKPDGTPIPEDQRKSTQFFKVMRQATAVKKRSAQSVAF